MHCDSSIDIAPDLTLDISAKGVRTKLRLTRKSAQQMAVVLREYAGMPSSTFDKGVVLNLRYAKHVSAESVDETALTARRSSGRSARRGSIVYK
jgi:hypothetical protein